MLLLILLHDKLAQCHSCLLAKFQRFSAKTFLNLKLTGEKMCVFQQISRRILETAKAKIAIDY